MPELYSGVLLFVDAPNTPAFLLFPTHVFSTLHEFLPPRPVAHKAVSSESHWVLGKAMIYQVSTREPLKIEALFDVYLHVKVLSDY